MNDYLFSAAPANVHMCAALSVRLMSGTGARTPPGEREGEGGARERERGELQGGGRGCGRAIDIGGKSMTRMKHNGG